jgi:Protein of unknown function (DUF3807)
MPSTQETLLRYHTSHFPGPPPPLIGQLTLELSSNNALDEFNVTAEVADVLGVYADGVERTLSDEQVAIFRHTEIQELLRERRERAGVHSGSAADRPGDAGPRTPAEALFAQHRGPSPTPSTVHDKDNCEAKEKEYPCVNAGRYAGRLNRASDQHYMDVDGAEQDLGQVLSAEQAKSMRISPCVRRIISYEEDNLAADPHQKSSTPNREESFIPKFDWPELRH